MKNLILNIKQNQSFLISTVTSIALIITSVALIKFNIKFLPSRIPLWYTRSWGEAQLAPKLAIYIIPLGQLVFTATHLLIINTALKRNKKEYAIIFGYTTVLMNILSLVISFRIISAATYFPYNFVDPKFLNLIPPFLAAFSVSLLSTKYVIKLANRFNIITNPKTDFHPAMLITKPVPRAGSAAFLIGFLTASLLFLPIKSKKVIGILLGTVSMVTLGVLDDKYKDINRYLRLSIMSIIAVVVSLFGVITFYLNNPFNSAIKLDTWVIKIQMLGGEHKLFPIALLFTALWIIWVMNTISWSNGIDGQFCGVAGITTLTIALLSLRFVPIDQENLQVATIAAISSGAIFGLTPATWYPQKILWGWGATAVGLVIATTSILSISKVAAASLVLLVPFLDGITAIVRRVIKGMSPLSGDREHLHHKLLDLGWSVPQIAIFYWIITATLSGIALASSGKERFLTIITFGGLVGFILAILNLTGSKVKAKRQQIV